MFNTGKKVSNLTAHERIEGSWANTVDPKKFGHCRHCGAQTVEVPQKGHINSVYWKLLQRPGEETLVCCPNGCTEEEGDITFAMSRPVVGMVTPKGKFYPKSEFVMAKGLCATGDFLYPEEAIGLTQEDLEERGWMFVDHGFFTWKKPITDMQKLYIHCFCFGRGIDEAQFKEDIELKKATICFKNLYEK